MIFGKIQISMRGIPSYLIFINIIIRFHPKKNKINKRVVDIVSFGFY